MNSRSARVSVNTAETLPRGHARGGRPGPQPTDRAAAFLERWRRWREVTRKREAAANRALLASTDVERDRHVRTAAHLGLVVRLLETQLLAECRHFLAEYRRTGRPLPGGPDGESRSDADYAGVISMLAAHVEALP